MTLIHTLRRLIFVVSLALLPVMAAAQDIARFVGTYAGNAEFADKGAVQKRDMSVVIAQTREGFVLTWASVSYKPDGRTKEKTYTIEFAPSVRPNIYQSSMKSNLFGKAVPLDPMAGEPFVWARIEGDMLSVFSLFIDETGEYEVQEFHRRLVTAGLELEFLRLRNGQVQRRITTTLLRQD